MSTKPTFVIVGAGLAGAKAAETLRADGFDGRLLLATGATPRRQRSHRRPSGVAPVRNRYVPRPARPTREVMT